MLYEFPGALHSAGQERAPRPVKKSVIIFALALLIAASVREASAQGLVRELNLPEKATVSVKNRNGRVTVIASDEQKGVASLKAESPGAAVEEADVVSTPSGGSLQIDVRGRREKDRIDVTIRVPSRTKVRVESEAGAVDVAGNFESAEVRTNTGTIHADVPTDALSFEFFWEASRPRFFSEVELPKVKEQRGGWYSISGKLGEKKAKKEERVKLSFSTQRGVILFNVDPSMVPSDLRDRPLTEAARAIVRSGDSRLMEAIRKVSPKLFGDYAKTLPPPKEAPSLVARSAPGEVATVVSPQLLRLNVSVTDRNGRAMSGLRAQDFTLFENGQERKIVDVVPVNAPFNLVLLLDVSGSVEERIDFIRKAARNFLATVSPQDRISIISFRDDIQIISEFTTDRQKLSVSLDKIDAGGGTALYDALAYTLVETLKPLRGERTAVVILSDGDDNKSFIPFGAIEEAIIESGALIYPLYVPSLLIPESSVAAPTTTLDPTRTRFLTITTRAEEEGKRLASVSGGVFYPIRRLEDLQRAYDDVVAQLRMSYTITYASNSAPTGGRRLRVRVNREGASARPSPAVNVADSAGEGARK
ncbi:MAG TPA: VWA domain-containing protein [Pyrinomonadaceae bacterium]|nr:VWA domain-containing protein [Pyrinomonadaceae bacterium]